MVQTSDIVPEAVATETMQKDRATKMCYHLDPVFQVWRGFLGHPPESINVWIWLLSNILEPKPSILHKEMLLNQIVWFRVSTYALPLIRAYVHHAFLQFLPQRLVMYWLLSNILEQKSSIHQEMLNQIA